MLDRRTTPAGQWSDLLNTFAGMLVKVDRFLHRTDKVSYVQGLEGHAYMLSEMVYGSREQCMALDTK